MELEESPFNDLYAMLGQSRTFTSTMGIAMAQKCQTQNLLAKTPFTRRELGSALPTFASVVSLSYGYVSDNHSLH